MLFKEIIGQREIVNKLIHTIKDGRISHAQLYLGPEGSGKLSIAMAYAQFVNCENKQYYTTQTEHDLKGDSCGVCRSCVKFAKLAHPDLHFIFPNATTKKVTRNNSSADFLTEWREFLIEKNYYITLNEWFTKLGVENKQGVINVRDCTEINHILSYKTYESDYKIMVIWMVDKLFHSAAPKILKILEEPPQNTLFLLIANNHDQMLATILSRTQLVKIPKIKDEDMMNTLINKHHLNETTALSITNLADGSYKEALNIIESDEGERYLTDVFIRWMRNSYAGNLNASAKGDIKGLNEVVSELSKLGRERQKNLLSYSLRIARNCVLINFNQQELLKLTQDESNFLSKFYKFINAKNIMTITYEFNKAIYHIERNANTTILFMDLSLKLNTQFKIT